jgi:hypothetical protein
MTEAVALMADVHYVAARRPLSRFAQSAQAAI